MLQLQGEGGGGRAATDHAVKQQQRPRSGSDSVDVCDWSTRSSNRGTNIPRSEKQAPAANDRTNKSVAQMQRQPILAMRVPGRPGEAHRQQVPRVHRGVQCMLVEDQVTQRNQEAHQV